MKTNGTTEAEDWFIGLDCKKSWKLEKALKTMASFKLNADDVPLIIKLVENPKYDIGLFAGNVSLHNLLPLVIQWEALKKCGVGEEICICFAPNIYFQKNTDSEKKNAGYLIWE
jgi:hypothetical protein